MGSWFDNKDHRNVESHRAGGIQKTLEVTFVSK
jgi:hypothetical protein